MLHFLIIFIILVGYIILAGYIAAKKTKYQLEILFLTLGTVMFLTLGTVMFLTLGTVMFLSHKKHIEGFDKLSDEALSNIASVYNGDRMVVKNLEVTEGLRVLKNANIAQFNIRDNRIGVQGAQDLLFNGGGNLDVLEYGSDWQKPGKLYVGKIANAGDYDGNSITCRNHIESKTGRVNQWLAVAGSIDNTAGETHTKKLFTGGVENSGDYTNLHNSITIVDYGKPNKVTNATNAGFRNRIGTSENSWGTFDLNRDAGGWDIDLRTK